MTDNELKEIEEGVKIISDFLNVAPPMYMDSIDPVNYYSDWNYLMNVIEKIESIKDDYQGMFGVHIVSNTCNIQSNRFWPDEKTSEPPYYYNSITRNNKRIATFIMVVKFIKWYNKNIKK